MAEIAGLKLIVPTSVDAGGTSSITVSASGKVTFSGVNDSNIPSVNGCFTADYDNYLIVFRATYSSGDEDLNIRWRAAGTNNTTGSSYTHQKLDASSTSVVGARSTSDRGFIGGISDDAPNGKHIYVYGPFLAQPTAYRNVDVSGHSGARIIDYASTHNQSTSYDGFSFWAGSGGAATMTGALCVYGLSQ